LLPIKDNVTVVRNFYFLILLYSVREAKNWIFDIIIGIVQTACRFKFFTVGALVMCVFDRL